MSHRVSMCGISKASQIDWICPEVVPDSGPNRAPTPRPSRWHTERFLIIFSQIIFTIVTSFRCMERISWRNFLNLCGEPRIPQQLWVVVDFFDSIAECSFLLALPLQLVRYIKQPTCKSQVIYAKLWETFSPIFIISGSGKLNLIKISRKNACCLIFMLSKIVWIKTSVIKADDCDSLWLTNWSVCI